MAAFEASFGRAADEDEAIPFAVCQGVEQAVRATGTLYNRTLRDWLAARTATRPVKTILGDFYWDPRGLMYQGKVLLTQWQDGNLRFIFPTDAPGVTDMIWQPPEW